jgi:aspartate aminotransferase-like enzyme
MDQRTLFIPGPTWVDPAARLAMSADMIGHRSPAFSELVAISQPILKEMAGTIRPMYLATCSSWGMMEACLRNLVRPGKRVLNCCNGAFSDRWHDVSLRCGLQADALRTDWGTPIDPASVTQALASHTYDLVTLVHAETSTGVLNPLKKIAEIVNRYPGTLLAVDTVSSYSATPLMMDVWGIDVMLAGTQKALALPPGLTVCAVSERALSRAGEVPGRGFYMDFLEYEKNACRDMTISTPAIPLIMGLAHRAREINAEGVKTRFERHHRCRRFVSAWAEKHGFTPVPPRGFRADTLNCLIPPEEMDTVVFAQRLKQNYGWDMANGKAAVSAFPTWESCLRKISSPS